MFIQGWTPELDDLLASIHAAAAALGRPESAIGFWGRGWLLRTLRDQPSLKPDARCLGLTCFGGDRSTGDWVSAARPLTRDQATAMRRSGSAVLLDAAQGLIQSGL